MLLFPEEVPWNGAMLQKGLERFSLWRYLRKYLDGFRCEQLATWRVCVLVRSFILHIVSGQFFLRVPLSGRQSGSVASSSVLVSLAAFEHDAIAARSFH